MTESHSAHACAYELATEPAGWPLLDHFSRLAHQRAKHESVKFMFIRACRLFTSMSILNICVRCSSGPRRAIFGGDMFGAAGKRLIDVDVEHAFLADGHCLLTSTCLSWLSLS